MRYQIEKTLLRGQSRNNGPDSTATILQTEGLTPQDALTRALLQDHAELVDEIHTLGTEAFAAAKKRDDLWLYRIEQLAS